MPLPRFLTDYRLRPEPTVGLRHTASRSAFSLIELLVVISIVGLLIALLLPTLAAARDEAVRVKCLAQVRGIATATVNYAVDHRQQLMMRGGSLAFPHASGGSPAGNEAINDFGRDYLQQRDLSLFCPSRLAERYSPTTYSLYADRYVSYQYFGDLDTRLSGGTWQVPKPAIDLQGPGELPIWACMTVGLTDGGWLGHDRPYTDTEPLGQSSVHLDGSAHWVAMDRLENYWIKNSNGQRWYWEP